MFGKLMIAVVMASVAVAAATPAAFADSPSNAEEAFRIPATITFTPNGVAVVPTLDTWTQGTSPTGAACCTNYFTGPFGTKQVATTKNQVASSFRIGGRHSVDCDPGFTVDSYDANGGYVGSVASEAPTFCLFAGPVQENAKRVGLNYRGNWFDVSGGTPWGGTQEESTTKGDSMTFNCGYCRSVEWITTTGPHQGSANVYINGTLIATIDTHASSTHYRQAVFGYDLPSLYTFSQIKIVNEGGTVGHSNVDVDAFVVTDED